MILSASVRLLPVPVVEETVARALDHDAAATIQRRILREPLPVTATCYHDGHLSLRLSGTRSAVDAAKQALDCEHESNSIWRQLRDHTRDFFATATIHRLSVPRGSFTMPPGSLVEWGGAQVWLSDAQGHAPKEGLPFGAIEPFDGARQKYERRLKEAFDPHGVFNPGFRGIGV